MSRTIIKVACVDQRLIVVMAPVVASGGVNEDLIEFDFCPLWDGFEKVATFYRSPEEVYHSQVVDNICVVPHEVLRDEGYMYFGVIGVNEEATRTSEVIRYTITEGAVTEGTIPADPTPDIYAQYIARIQKLERRVTNLEANGGGGGEGGGSGFSPTVEVTEIEGGHRLTITDINGTASVDVMNGSDGQDGKDGQPGKDGEPGYTPQKGVDYFDGEPGAAGKDGYTPVKGKDYFDGQPGKDGSPGKDGVSVTHSWTGTVLSVTSASGTSSADLKGQPGKDGSAGADGADGFSPTVSVSKSGKVTTISITDKNGTKTATVNDGADGQPGATGATGPAGKTPVKGVDYFTPADQEAVVQQVIAALGTPVFGRVDAENNIILTGALGEGAYTFVYEDSDGVRTTIGTLGHDGTETPVYTNLLPTAIDTNGSTYNGIGWKPNIRLGSGGTVTEASATDIETTGFMPVSGTDTIYFANITFPYDSSKNAYQYFAIYDASKAKLTCNKINIDLSAHGVTYDANKNMTSLNVAAYMTHYSASGTPAFFRFCAEEISSESIVTVNQPIS